MQSFRDKISPARDKQSPQGHFRDFRDKKSPVRDIYIRDGSQVRSSFYIMPRKRKDCPICGKINLLKLSNHLAGVHELSATQRQPFLIRAKSAPLDLEVVLTELYRLIGSMI
jgi:hypothetical protein